MAATSLTDINGLTKRVYDKSGIKDLRSSCGIIQKKAAWDKGSRNIGESYQVPVSLRYPNGFTYLGSAGAANTSTLAVRPQITKQASITPFSMLLREQLVFAALTRAAEQGEGAFAALSGETMKAMKVSASNRLEIGIIRGQSALGTVEAVTNLGSSQMDITITAATWNPGMWWALGEGTTLDAWTLPSTKDNGTAALVVAGVKASERKITVSHGGTFSSECAADDVLYFEGVTTDPADATLWAEMPGLIAQASNTSGTSLGLSAATYSNWKGNTYPVGGAISADVIEDAVSQLRDRGATGKLSMYVSNKAFSVLMAEAKVNRNYDASYSPERAKQGHKSMSYASPDVGEIELVNHPFFTQGEFLLIDTEDTGRVGSSDLEFGVPGISSVEDLWNPVANSNVAEILLTTDQCVILKKPNHAMYGSGILYT